MEAPEAVEVPLHARRPQVSARFGRFQRELPGIPPAQIGYRPQTPPPSDAPILPPVHTAHIWPFESFPVVESHVHPFFVICNAAAKGMRFNARGLGDDARERAIIAHLIYGIWMNSEPPKPATESDDTDDDPDDDDPVDGNGGGSHRTTRSQTRRDEPSKKGPGDRGGSGSQTGNDSKGKGKGKATGGRQRASPVAEDVSDASTPDLDSNSVVSAPEGTRCGESLASQGDMNAGHATDQPVACGKTVVAWGMGGDISEYPGDLPHPSRLEAEVRAENQSRFEI